jgi:hypothetical protein
VATRENNEAMNYEIGASYRYPLGKQVFKLKEVDGYRFHFECGHSVTDSVFEDLINIKTGIQVYKDLQHRLIFEPPI